jgi:hypothetical protein
MKTEVKGYQGQPGIGKKQGVTPFQVIIGLILIVIIGFYMSAHHIGQSVPFIDFGGKSPNAGQMGLLFLLILVVNPFLFLLTKKRLFSQKDYVVIYTMISVAGFTLFAFMAFLVISWMGLQRYAMENPLVYEPYLDSISHLIIPKSQEAVQGFWLGESEVPWSEWMWPGILWTLFYGVFIFFGTCMAVIVRRRWTEHEHLTYPLAMPVLEVTGDSERPSPLGPMWKNKLLLSGFAISALFTFYAYLTDLYPGLPFFKFYNDANSVQLHYVVYNLINKIRADLPSNVSTALTTHMFIDPFAIGLGYLISLDFLFSYWFFVLFARVENLLWLSSGFNKFLIKDYIYSHDTEAFAGFITVGILYLYLMRDELKLIFVKGFFGRDVIDDSEEPMPYKVALGGIIGSLIFFMVFGKVFLKIGMGWTLLYFLIYLSALVTILRGRAEVGFGAVQLTGRIYDKYDILGLFGTRRIGAGNLLGLSFFTQINYAQGGLGGVFPGILESWKMADEVGIKKRQITAVAFVAFFAAMAVGFLFALPMVYKTGAYLAERRLLTTHSERSWGSFKNLYAISAPNRNYLIFYLKGAVTTGFLFFMRTRFPWWPLNPLGYVFGYAWLYYYLLSGSFFIAWVVKYLVIRYGGMENYRKLRPFFIGLIAGEFTTAGITSVIGFIVNLMR